MTPRTLATVAALTSLLIGTIGLAWPGAFGTAFGIQFDPVAVALARLACAAYIGYAVLAWFSRDLTDPTAWRAVTSANAIGWGLSAVVLAGAVLSGTGDARIWVAVAMQVGFAVAWSATYIGVASATPRSA